MGPDPHLAGSSCEANTSVNAARAQASSALDTVIQEEFHCKGGDPNKGTVCGAILMAWIVFMGMTANKLTKIQDLVGHFSYREKLKTGSTLFKLVGLLQQSAKPASLSTEALNVVFVTRTFSYKGLLVYIIAKKGIGLIKSVFHTCLLNPAMTTTCLKLQAMTFMTSVHYRYYCAHGKGKNNPKNIGERLKSAEEPAKGHHKKVPGARGRADTIWVTHSSLFPTFKLTVCTLEKGAPAKRLQGLKRRLDKGFRVRFAKQAQKISDFGVGSEEEGMEEGAKAATAKERGAGGCSSPQQGHATRDHEKALAALLARRGAGTALGRAKGHSNGELLSLNLF
ncbi:hypothetical protein Anapl_04982 [Anas platyrhynchos]|uniref:Uncharacterized protein n=1 Tax=Anas platyrhynchos TaxID=8839 RepID=R0K3R1_ANAPL|nr:hypothetical protein Anapl_04982 [Anas platyrhynchos]